MNTETFAPGDTLYRLCSVAVYGDRCQCCRQPPFNGVRWCFDLKEYHVEEVLVKITRWSNGVFRTDTKYVCSCSADDPEDSWDCIGDDDCFVSREEAQAECDKRNAEEDAARAKAQQEFTDRGTIEHE